MTASQTFADLKNKLAEATDLKGAMALLMWDQEVMMPTGGIRTRARQMSTLSGIQHDLFVQQCGTLIRSLRGREQELSEWEQINFQAIVREFDRMEKVPTALVMEMQHAAVGAQHAWEQARKAGDFAHFQPALEKLLQLKLQEADALGYEKNPYDAHLETFEPGATAARLTEFFALVRRELSPLLEAIRQAPQVDDTFLNQEVPVAAQLAFTEKVLARMGYSFEHGRQDVSTHPFTIGMGPEDVRVTTRAKLSDVTECLYSSIHEGGHALYEQGLPMEHYGLPAAENASIGIHESQSRVWENNVGRSLSFWEYWFEEFRELFPDKLKGKSAMDVFRAVNKVTPSLIRTAADELTYHFHIMLRFEIENSLLNGEVKVAELPEIWNAKVKQYLGLDVPNPLVGVLQDVHWSHGSFGYFPTYSLGSFYAAQFMHKATEALPTIQAQLRAGEMGDFRNWLKHNIHQKGRLQTPENLALSVSGEMLNVKYFIDYAKEKFGVVYGIKIG